MCVGDCREDNVTVYGVVNVTGKHCSYYSLA